jgi:hypothetical protein
VQIRDASIESLFFYAFVPHKNVMKDSMNLNKDRALKRMLIASFRHICDNDMILAGSWNPVTIMKFVDQRIERTRDARTTEE